MEPLEYLRVLRQRWYIPVVAVVLGLAAAWVTTPDVTQAPPTQSYTATHTLLKPESGTEYGLDMMALLAKSGDIPARVAERLGEDIEPALLASEVEVTGDSDLRTLTVTSTQRDGERAAQIANLFAEEIVAYFDEQARAAKQESVAAMQEQMEQQEQRIRELDDELARQPSGDDADLLAAERDALLTQYGSSVQQVQQLSSETAAPSGLISLQEAFPIPLLEEGFQPPRGRDARMGIGALVALVLGAGLVVLLDQLDTKVRTRRVAERAFGLPVVTEVPKLLARQRRGFPVIAAENPSSYAAEAYRVLRLSLQLMPRWILPAPSLADASGEVGERRLAPRATAGPATVVLVTSPGPGEGKTTTVANLAASYAEVGKVVLVLDCDFRHPEQHDYLQTERAPGVSDFLARTPDRPALQQLARQTNTAGVWLVPNGSPTSNPGQLVGPDQDLVAAAAELADVVIIDAGPLLSVTDPAALMPRADAVVVVARSGHTTSEAAFRTSELLARLEAPVLGVALVAVPRGAIAPRYHDRSAPQTKRSERRRDHAEQQSAHDADGSEERSREQQEQ